MSASQPILSHFNSKKIELNWVKIQVGERNQKKSMVKVQKCVQILSCLKQDWHRYHFTKTTFNLDGRIIALLR